MIRNTITLADLAPEMLNLKTLAGIAVNCEGLVFMAHLNGDVTDIANKSERIIPMVGGDLTIIKEIHISSAGNCLLKVEGLLNVAVHDLIDFIKTKMIAEGKKDFVAPAMTNEKGITGDYYLSGRSGIFKLLSGVSEAKIHGTNIVYVTKSRPAEVLVAQISEVVSNSSWQQTAKTAKHFTHAVAGLGFRHTSYAGIPVTLFGYHQAYVVDSKQGTCNQLDVSIDGDAFRGVMELNGTPLQLFEGGGQIKFATHHTLLAGSAKA